MLTPAQVENRIDETIEKYSRYLNSGWASLVKFMGFGTVEAEAHGAMVRDLRGEEYLDCLGGVGVFALGHTPEPVVAAVRAQLDRMAMSSRLLFNERAVELAELLAQVTPGDLQYSFFCNSGAEANEGALKLARLATGKKEIISTEGAFHGKTLGALSASGRDLYKTPFAPLVPGFIQVPFGDVKAMADAITEDTAAILVEPIQGEAGVIVPPDDYLPRLRDLCTEQGILLLVDEVQTGLGRTGKLFAVEHYGVVPDVLILAKALGGGVMPIGAFIATAELWQAMQDHPLLHSSTFGGNPLACAAATAAVRAIIEQGLPQRAAELGAYLLERLEAVRQRFPEHLREVRGRGLLIGVEFADSDLGGLVIAGLAQRHILAGYTLNNPQVIRFEPPLIITREQLDQAIQAFTESLEQAVEIASTLG